MTLLRFRFMAHVPTRRGEPLALHAAQIVASQKRSHFGSDEQPACPWLISRPHTRPFDRRFGRWQRSEHRYYRVCRPLFVNLVMEWQILNQIKQAGPQSAFDSARCARIASGTKRARRKHAISGQIGWQSCDFPYSRTVHTVRPHAALGHQISPDMDCYRLARFFSRRFRSLALCAGHKA